ncbi:DEAD/DEAH box helicase [Novosphingobium sp. 1949]|uniref:DEAD/DEAH box helicase n=1 Tax=Novosphingobium organovorum TaxID=2930092 RepID=A0ABT0B9A8_9SPHN|nr:DEAD/DEAH box helicase [Novosphingobium organovorum]MCJ2181443.1 DEAD/DEAH box helicase [Novosphingobium organovorum]
MASHFDHLPAPLVAALDGQGYEKLTAVQEAVCEADAAGRDLLVSAQTGSGKTVAFGLAMAQELLEGDSIARSFCPLALVIAPTRELAMQVSRELSWLYGSTGARIVTCVGGMDPVAERKKLEKGASIVVGTPGRLRDHLERGKLDLSELRVAVLDEADEMLDMGFREDLETLLDATGAERRTLLFSATMPRGIEQLARQYQNNALRISTVGETRGHGDISYQAVTVTPSDVENAAINILRFHEAETAILFCSTREKVKHLHAALVERGFSAVALSGEHSQNERNNALQALRDHRARVCVATDVAARGIDLPSLTLVVHVELPRDAETLQHRSGRTGRAGKKGTAVLLVPHSRRRKVEYMLRDARIPAEWTEVPGPEVIRAKDRERIIEALTVEREITEDDREIARELLQTIPAEDIAAALVAAQRATMPQPEELIGRIDKPGRGRSGEGFENSVWFKMNIGRKDQAEPRWVLPVVCRRGHVSSDVIGQIRILVHETFIEIPGALADRFEQTLAKTAGSDEDHFEKAIQFERALTPPPARTPGHRSGGGPREGYGQGPRGEGRTGPHKPRPYSSGGTGGGKPNRREGPRRGPAGPGGGAPTHKTKHRKG